MFFNILRFQSFLDGGAEPTLVCWLI